MKNYARWPTLALTTLALISGCSNDGEADEPPHTKNKHRPAAYQAPESAIAYGDHWIVSNVGAELKPMAKDGDGSLLLVPKGGDLSRTRPIGSNVTLHAPKGTLVVDDSLYVVDIDTLHRFDLNTLEHRQAIVPHDFLPHLKATQFLNGIALGDNGDIFVSASDTSDIYVIHPGEHVRVAALELSTPLKGPNGLVWDSQDQRLYVAEWGTDNKNNGRLGYIDISGEAPYEFTVLGEHTGYLDGLQKIGEQLYFSDWVAFENAGKIFRYDLSTNEQSTINDAPIAGPADFHLSADGSALIVPHMLGNRVTTVPINSSDD